MTLIVLFAILMATNAFKIENYQKLPTPNTMNDDFEATTARNDSEDSVQRVIYPGTKWCGYGDKAANYSDLGRKVETDKCCRAHDKCPQQLLPFESKYGIKNPGIITRSNCECDLAFYECLKSAKTYTSSIIGRLYFNMVGSLPTSFQCFREDYPISGCNKHISYLFFFKRCTEYSFYRSKAKKYQWFDLPRF